MRTSLPAFSLLRSRLRAGLLALLFSSPKASYYLRELVRRLQVSPGALARELATLEREGVLTAEWKGRQKYFSINPRYPLYTELHSLIQKAGRPPAARPGGKKASLYLIAGPNGAGKTTFAKKFLPDYAGCKEFVNADLIAGGIAPLAPNAAALRAGRFLLNEIRHLGTQGVDFAFETTLSGKTHFHLLQDFRERGYAVHLFFLWISDLELSLRRIEERVKRGGHEVPEPVVRRRFHKGIRNLFHLYRPLFDSWTIFENSGAAPHLVAYEIAGKRTVLDAAFFAKIRAVAGEP